MDRLADDASSDVAVAGSSVTGTRRGGRESDKPYRRPPAQPPAESMTGGSWFTDGTEMPDDEPEPADAGPGEPRYGPAPPATSGRASYGFSGGPISPSRSVPAAAAPGRRSAEPAGTELPIRRQGGGGSVESNTGGHGVVTPNWPPPARLDPEPSILDPMSDTGSRALRAPSGEYGEYAEWPAADSTGERRALRRAPESGRAPESDWPALDNTAERRLTARHEQPAAGKPGQSRGVTVGIVLLSVVVLVAGAVMGVVYFSGSDQKLDPVLQLGAGGNQRAVSAPLDNRTKASFELLAGANTVHVTIGELGDDLFRISTPDDAGIKPVPEIRNDDVKLQVAKDGDGIGGEIEVVLAAKVRWALRFSGYAETQLIDVSGGQISGIEMVAGTRRAELTLSQPAGTIPVKINGAVDSLVLKSPSDNPVRIKVGGGAQTVVAGTRTLKDVKAGSTLTPKGWNTTNRYDVTAGARITTLTVENAP